MTNRSKSIIQLMESGGLSPHNVDTSRVTRSLPKGTGSLKTSQGFEYGSGQKQKDRDKEHQEYMKRKFMLTPMTGLRG